MSAGAPRTGAAGGAGARARSSRGRAGRRSGHVTTPSRAPAECELAATAARSTSWSRGSRCAAPARGWSSWREQVAAAKRRSFRAERYWGRPIPGWGDAQPGWLIVGLAPAAHGGNRTGRIFTGDRSGDVLFASLYRCGLAAQAEQRGGRGRAAADRRAHARGGALRPAGEQADPDERDTCAPWLAAELGPLLPTLRAIVCLGAFAWQAVWRAARRGWASRGPGRARRSATAPRSSSSGRAGRRVTVSGWQGRCRVTGRGSPAARWQRAAAGLPGDRGQSRR